MLLSDFDFELPRDLIASHPLAQRDASRMLVMDAEGNISDKHIRDFLDYLQPGDVVVFNNSRVIPARFMASGHEITLHTALANDTWWGLCRKFKKFERGQILTLDDGTEIEVLSTNRDSGVKIKFHCDDVFGVLQRVGKLPLPPYMHREQEDSDQERYQTVYAEPLGSMAAPTAGLHFTDELMQEIENRGAKVLKVTLHVGAGTWMPVKTENVNDHKMHSEWGEITQAQAEIINSAARVIAVGTTSLRLLESAAQMARHLRSGTRVVPYSRRTNIFIRPGYRMRAVDVLLTNFHLPKSTLFMLVSAFSGLDQIKNAYAHAISEQYRFFSYGDCCLLFRRAYQIQRRTGAHVEPDVPDSDETMSEPDNIMEQHTSDEQLISE
ncbi:MAG: tRNA preQ1(34) S-adenosylmethionine ribosyltransferase-isomerase QueA [Alphaproteobacteria bacterium]|nr:tRNA preQ1(34) S-adenosylmethionine ribosyltransferase-isomerase QueA [Alphaproteobacteria bacterium]